MARKRREIPVVHVKERSNGRFAYFFEGIKVNGKRTQISKGGFASSEEALAAGEIAIVKYYFGGQEKASECDNMISVEDFVTKIFMPKQAELKHWVPNTRDGYEKKFRNNVFPTIGKEIIGNLSPETLTNLLDNLYYDKKRSFSSVSNLHSLLLSMAKYAVKKGYLESFDRDEFPVPKRDEDAAMEEHNEQNRDTVPAEKLDAIFERFDENSSVFLPMVISLLAGARIGEACAIAVEDCDFENRLLHIRRQFTADNKFQICNPKNNSKRVVPMCDSLYEILKAAVEKRERNMREWGGNYIRTYLKKANNTPTYRNLPGFYDINYDGNGNEIHFLNVTEYGKIIYPSVLKHSARVIHGYSTNPKNKKKKGKAIYKYYNNHSLRHTFASRLNSLGVPDYVISALLGHKKQASQNASRTTQKYIHLSNEDLLKYAPIIEKVYTFKK